MGQKVNPIGLRLGVNRTWDSRWFAGKGEYAKLLVGYEYDMKDDSLTVFSVMQDGLEWVDYLNTATRQYLCKYINERIEK